MIARLRNQINLSRGLHIHLVYHRAEKFIFSNPLYQMIKSGLHTAVALLGFMCLNTSHRYGYMNWRATRIRDRNGDLIVIPNGQLANATIINFDQPSRLHRVKVDVQIERTAPPTAAIAMLVDAARSTPGVVEDPPPFARVTQIADPVVDYQASMWIEDYALAPQVKADFGALVWYLSYRHDVPLPNPAQDIYVFDGAKTAIDSQITTAEIRRRIVDMPLVAGLDDNALDNLAAVASIEQYQQGETILEEGTERDLLLLDAGRARLVLRRDDADELNVVDLEAGEVLGVLNELPESGRAMVVAMTDCDIVRIPPDGASRAIALAPDLAEMLDQLATTRRRRIERVMRRSNAEAARALALPTHADTPRDAT